MKKIYCDYCGKLIKTKSQSKVEFYTCDTGDADNPNGPENEDWKFSLDLCLKCAKKLKDKKLIK